MIFQSYDERDLRNSMTLGMIAESPNQPHPSPTATLLLTMPTDTFTTGGLPDLTLRPAQAADQSAIDQLYFACRADLHALPMPAEIIAHLIKQQQQIQAHGLSQQYPKAQTLVLAQGAQVLARIIFDTGSTDIRLIDIMVLPMVQRRGLARQLLRYLQQQAASQQLPLRLGVMKDNPKAIALYLSCGFRVSSEDYLEQQMQWLAEAL
jgi:ribosomal protein S18 acetylase RimI-like enzyme